MRQWREKMKMRCFARVILRGLGSLRWMIVKRWGFVGMGVRIVRFWWVVDLGRGYVYVSIFLVIVHR
jgi:hypothetical protein